MTPITSDDQIFLDVNITNNRGLLPVGTGSACIQSRSQNQCTGANGDTTVIGGVFSTEHPFRKIGCRVP